MIGIFSYGDRHNKLYNREAVFFSNARSCSGFKKFCLRHLDTYHSTSYISLTYLVLTSIFGVIYFISLQKTQR